MPLMLLKQEVSEPTRGNVGLDKILTDLGGYHQSPVTTAPIGNSDPTL